MNGFVDYLENASNMKHTENGAVTLSTSKSAILDLFGMGAALRTRKESEIKSLFARAFSEDALLALKCLFYIRDIRGGQGERKTFRVCLDWLVENYPAIVSKNFMSIPFYGRWDDAFHNDTMIDFIVEHAPIADFINGFFRSLGERPYGELTLAKWLPSENASSKDTKNRARIMRRMIFKMSPKQYRKSLSEYRKKLEIVETQMSQKKWSEIKYEKVPSRASMVYRKAFGRHDSLRYASFIDAAKNGEKKIHSATLYPYELVEKAWSGEDGTIEALWRNLPDYVNGGENSLVVADVSGSMSGTPLNVALSLALYFAERNKNAAYKNKFISFSNKPTFQHISGSTLTERLRSCITDDWQMNTNLEAVFKLVLDTAVKHGIPKEEMPSRLFIVSDMEFDSTVKSYQKTMTFHNEMKELFARFGYELPGLVYWNVNARNDNLPVDKDEAGTILVSGCSPSIFKSIMGQKDYNPYSFMLEVLNSERYERITI